MANHVRVTVELQGTIVGVFVDVGASVEAGDVLALVESMKMHHDVVAPVAGVVESLAVGDGDTIAIGQEFARIVEGAGTHGAHPVANTAPTSPVGLERDDLREVIDRHAVGLDEQRPRAVERRRARGRRTARENIGDLVDDGTFVEYGPLVIAAQRRRRSVEDLIASTPADGLVGGIGEVNGELFGSGSAGRAAKTVAVSYDYTVLAGTQGTQNHRKKDRLFEVAEQLRLPIVFFTEGGGGRPGDTDGIGVSGLDCLAFRWFAELSGTVPLVGVNSGYCFAGNAAILGCCDVVIATEDSNIGMGGPAMIEGGGLGVFEPTEIGPIDVQRRNGVVDVVVADEVEAVDVAKRYLSYFQGRTTTWSAPDQAALRDVVPVDRLRAYDIRRAIDGLFDTDSVLELRREFGVGMVTALAGSRAAPSGSSRTTPVTSPERSTPTAPTRQPDSCSCATRSVSRSSRWSTRRG